MPHPVSPSKDSADDSVDVKGTIKFIGMAWRNKWLIGVVAAAVASYAGVRADVATHSAKLDKDDILLQEHEKRLTQNETTLREIRENNTKALDGINELLKRSKP